MPQSQKINPSGSCFKQELNWPVLYICLKFVQFNVALLVNILTFLFVVTIGFFLVGVQLVICPLRLSLCPSFLHLSRSHLEQFLQF